MTFKMRNFAQFVLPLTLLLGGAGTAGAADLPTSAAYTFYVDGVRVGHSDVRIEQSATRLVITSKARVELGPNVLELDSRTVADPRTYVIREFSFEGTKGGMPAACHVELRGDTAVGWVRSTSSSERRPRKQVHPGGFAVWEDWVMDLEIIMALRQDVDPRPTAVFRVLFANNFLTADLMSGYTSEVLVESATRSMVARKMEVVLSGGDPFESHVDPETGIPVYLRFPGSRTEIFRDDFFGQNPAPRYTPPPGARQE